jgi:hypothetical protein
MTQGNRKVEYLVDVLYEPDEEARLRMGLAWLDKEREIIAKEIKEIEEEAERKREREHDDLYLAWDAKKLYGKEE